VTHSNIDSNPRSLPHSANLEHSNHHITLISNVSTVSELMSQVYQLIVHAQCQ